MIVIILLVILRLLVSPQAMQSGSGYRDDVIRLRARSYTKDILNSDRCDLFRNESAASSSVVSAIPLGRFFRRLLVILQRLIAPSGFPVLFFPCFV